MTRTTLGTCCGCGFGASVPYTPDLKPGTPVVVLTEAEHDRLCEYHTRVGVLLGHLSMLDPNGQPEKHPDWPLQLRGDEDACNAVCENLSALEPIHDCVAPWLLGVSPSPTNSKPQTPSHDA